jgi:hypothetical protein
MARRPVSCRLMLGFTGAPATRQQLSHPKVIPSPTAIRGAKGGAFRGLEKVLFALEVRVQVSNCKGSGLSDGRRHLQPVEGQLQESIVE